MSNSIIQSQEAIDLKEKVNRNLLYVGIFSSIMLFSGLTSAYIVRQADGGWLLFSMPFMFWISTGIILISSITANWAVVSVKKDNFKNVKIALGTTLLLGIVFCITQFLGWNELTKAGIFFAGKQSNSSGSFFYVLTGVHFAHIISGLIYLSVIFIKSLKNTYHSGNIAGVKHSAIFWHFLDAVWVYLFVFLLLMQ